MAAAMTAPSCGVTSKGKGASSKQGVRRMLSGRWLARVLVQTTLHDVLNARGLISKTAGLPVQQSLCNC